MKRTFLILLFITHIVPLFALDIIFRYDDFRLVDNELQNQLVEVFASEQVPLHIAVIPFYPDTTPILQTGTAVNRVLELHKQGILQIALHGFCHKGETFQGEFLPLNEEGQRFRLEKGSAFLDSVFGTHIHVFIPPWNRYNQTTLDILAAMGYNIISSELAENQLVSDARFQYYPEAVDHPYKLKAIFERNAKREALVVCMFHCYDFSDAYTMEDLRDMLREIKANPHLHILTMDELYQRDQSFNETRIKANLHHPLLTKLLRTRPIILPVSEAKRLRMWDLLLHLLLVLIIAGVGAVLLRHVNWHYWVSQIAILVLAGLQTWYQFVMPKLGLPLIALSTMIVCLLFYLLSRKTWKEIEI